MLRITDQGKDAMLKALPLWEEAQAWIIGQIGEERWKAMLGDWSELAALAQK
jgi:hypothetical protein